MSSPARGAEPAGSVDEQSAGQAVRSMFNSIAPRYDLLNHVLSANVDRLWWRHAAATFTDTLQKPEAEILDMCCGTGDMTLALLRLRPESGKPVVALDFAESMLARAREKFSSAQFASHGTVTIEADALHMPLDDASFDLVTSAFGFRNLANYQAGLTEIHRVLRPGGELGILDFSEPEGAVGTLYQFYFHRILPRVGRLLSGAAASYQYLPRSVHRFPAPDAMLAMLRDQGFRDATWTPYTFGIAGLFRAVKT